MSEPVQVAGTFNFIPTSSLKSGAASVLGREEASDWVAVTDPESEIPGEVATEKGLAGDFAELSPPLARPYQTKSTPFLDHSHRSAEEVGLHGLVL